MDVGVRDLQRRLSEYLDRVARGEVIRVIDRGQPRAMLVPIGDPRTIERGVREGWLSPGEERPPRPVRRGRSRHRILDLLRDDRDGR
jgi:prevent-host-death family protein